MSRGISSQQIAREYKHGVLQDYSGNITSVHLDPSHATRTILFPDRPKSFFSAALNAAQNVVAINVDAEAHLFDLDSGNVNRLKGHTSPVHVLAFSPTDNVLITCATPMSSRSEDDEGESEIITWDIDEVASKQPISIADEAGLEQLAASAVATVQMELKSRKLEMRLDQVEEKEIREAIAKLLGRYQTQRHVGPENRLVGRLTTSFGSASFSPDGRRIIYLPGGRPESYGDEQWDILVHDLISKSTVTLCGHRDAVMSTSFSPDMRTIASVAWDGTVRIWEADTGVQRHVFETGHQSWAGVFSPDSRFFLGTTGNGLVRIWDVETGAKKWEWNYGDWCRAVDWSHDGRWFVVGGTPHGRLVIFEVTDSTFESPPQMRHDRKLGLQDALEGPHAATVGRRLEVQRAGFLGPSAGGVKVASITGIDQAVEVFDLESCKKWRVIAKDGDSDHCSAHFHWMEKKGELLTVGQDGIRTWKLE